ncbi:SocA family protein [bacterium]|nr:SocA family protein [bacterium]
MLMIIIPNKNMAAITTRQKELAQYIIERYPGTHRYPVLKLMYLIEEAYLDEFGIKLSEDRYFEMKYGPVPNKFKTFIEEMGENNVTIVESSDGSESDIKRLYPGDNPDIKPKFTSIETRLIDHVLDFLHEKTGFKSDSLHDVCKTSPRWQRAQRTKRFRWGPTYILPKQRIQNPSKLQHARKVWKDHLENSSETPTDKTHQIETATIS